LGLALDELRDNDQVFDYSDFTYVIEKNLFEQIRPVKVDFVNSMMGSGFDISSGMQMDSSCGSSCSC